jgi:hypothetical protein
MLLGRQDSGLALQRYPQSIGGAAFHAYFHFTG